MFWSDTKKTTAKVILLILPVALVTGCNATDFNTINEQAKSKLMSDQYVFNTPPARAPASESSSGSSDPSGSDQVSQPNVGSSDPAGLAPTAPAAGNPSTPGTFRPDDTVAVTPIKNGTVMPPSTGSGEVKPSEGGHGTSPVTGNPGTVVPPVITPVEPAPAPPTPAPVVVVETPVVVPPGPVEVPLLLVCSNMESGQKGTNLRATSTLKAEIIQYKKVGSDLTEVSRCVEDSADLAAQLIASKSLVFSACAPKGTLLNGREDVAEGDYFKVDFVADGGVSLLSRKGPKKNDKVNVLYDVNGVKSKNRSGFSTTAAHQALCDANASPLFVDMRSEYERTQKFSLRAPWEGVLFDILGKNADPVAHSPNYISWFESAAMAYITLPNKRGQVLGIDQLFGDNTLGPDQEFAANGYAALAKYDLNKDQLINSDDAVYAKLKIWQDRNLDGKAASSELKSLSEAKIEVIDLRYDDSFSEEDIYGNSIKYKSVVKMSNGEYRLVFDIWFELNLYKAQQRFIELSSL